MTTFTTYKMNTDNGPNIIYNPLVFSHVNMQETPAENLYKTWHEFSPLLVYDK